MPQTDLGQDNFQGPENEQKPSGASVGSAMRRPCCREGERAPWMGVGRGRLECLSAKSLGRV